VDKDKLERLLDRLEGIFKSLSEEENLKGTIADDYNEIVEEFSKLTEKNLDDYKIPAKLYWKDSLGIRLVSKGTAGRIREFYSYVTTTDDFDNLDDK
jgi:hypothetical protein